MIMRFLILSSCLFYTSRGVDDSPEVKGVTVPTIHPQKLDEVPTPKRVYPTIKVNTTVSASSVGLAENATTTMASSTMKSTTVTAVVKEESVEEEQEEEQKPPTVEEEFVKVKEQPVKPAAKTKVDQLVEPEDSNFLSFILVGGFLVVCVYLLQHNKKKILGLMFEGRNGRRNVRYRRLSQREDSEQYRQEDIIY